MTKIILAVAAVIVAAAIGTAMVVGFGEKTPALSRAMLAVDGADIGGPFELTDHRGARVTSADVITGPTLVYFGYTYCPDICPIDVQTMADTVEVRAGKGIDVKPVFVTIDPERDTAEELAGYAEVMHPRMTALTGSAEDIRAAADAYRVYYNRVDIEGSAAEYLMEHTGFTYLMLPGDKLAAMFRNGFPPEHLAADIERVLEGG